MSEIHPLFNAEDDEWVRLTGRYILNLGAIEAVTRILIFKITGSDSDPVYSDHLAARLGFVRKRFPQSPAERHSVAMKVFEVAFKHLAFRNIVAHSPLAITGNSDGSFHIHGILNIAPQGKSSDGEIVSIDELKTRVDESAALARDLLAMQSVFP